MSGVTGFATGMIAGALWLVFFIGLGLTARKSPGHPFKSIKRFRSSTKSLDLDVPSALKPPAAPSPGSPEVRVLNPATAAARNTGEWEQPRSPRNGRSLDEPRPKHSSRQFQRPTLRPVPDLLEPTVQMDSAAFFEPEHPRTRTRPARLEEPRSFEQPQIHRSRIETEHPALAQASANSGSGGFGGGEMGGGRVSRQPPMSASNQPPRGPQEPVRGPDPGYPTSPGFPPEPFPQPHPGPGQQAEQPSLPAFPPPAPFEEPKQGRFGIKGRTKAEKPPKPEKAPKPAAAAQTPPAPPASAVAPQEKAKKEKKGLFRAPSKSKEVSPAAVPPPTIPPVPATPPKPRFTAPFNYTPPTATPPATPPTYRTTPTTGPANRSPWGPPASFNPPASPSFGNWGPQPVEPQAAAPTTPPATPGEPFVPPASPSFTNRNGNGLKEPEGPATDSGAWPFGFSAADPAETGTPHRDPELPAYIELSMFQDPTSADDIAAEQDSESDAPEAEADEAAEGAGAQEAWLADDAWPAPKEAKHRRQRDPWPTEDIPSVDETQLLEQHWPQDAPQTEEVADTDWTSADTPWPGETRRPAEPTWAAEPPAAESQPPPQQWGDESWQHEARPPAPRPVAEPRWTHREPSEEQPATDPWTQRRSRPAEQPAAAAPAEDTWVQPRIPDPEPVHPPAEPALMEHRAPAEPDPAPAPQAPSNGRGIFIDDEEDWKPLSIDLNLDEDRPSLDPVIEAATRLKAAETAIKVENGLAYVLVDDEGRPVLR